MNIWAGSIKFLTIACIRIFVILIIYVSKVPLITVALIIGALLIALLARMTQKKVRPIYDQLKDINENLQRQSTKMIMEKILISLSRRQNSEITSIDNIASAQPVLSRRSDFRNNI